MTDFIIKDIDELIKLQKGDSSRLNKIKENFEKTKIISIQDRKYVEYLASRYLHEEPKPKPKKSFEKSLQELGYKRPKPQASTEQPAEKIEPKENLIKKSVEKQSILKNKIYAKRKLHQSTVFESPSSPRVISFKPKKLGIIIIPIIAVIIIAAAATQADFSGFPSDVVPKSTPKTSPKTPTSGAVSVLSLDLDSRLYSKADIISISGQSEKAQGDKIKLSIQNPNGNLVWSEEVKIKDNGKFSTLLIAGGNGWDVDGTYTVKAEHGSYNTQITFDFDV